MGSISKKRADVLKRMRADMRNKRWKLALTEVIGAEKLVGYIF